VGDQIADGHPAVDILQVRRAGARDGVTDADPVPHIIALGKRSKAFDYEIERNSSKTRQLTNVRNKNRTLLFKHSSRSEVAAQGAHRPSFSGMLRADRLKALASPRKWRRPLEGLDDLRDGAGIQWAGPSKHCQAMVADLLLI
jgi:hypothetical protein